MQTTLSAQSKSSALILGVFIALGLALLGYFLSSAAIEFKQYERSVTVKGLSEREYTADIVLWPIQFSAAGNNLEGLYNAIEGNTNKLTEFLVSRDIDASEITLASPTIHDKLANQYSGNARPEFRYTASQTVTVYSKNIEGVRLVMGSLAELGKQGIVFGGDNYGSPTQYLFTRLNEVKPEMIEEATRKAREVAEKFASDSQSTLGKIKQASQGQFSISARDNNNPHIKKVRVVSTVKYYLSD